MFGWKRKKDVAPEARAPELPLDLTSAAFVADPYPAYTWLRNAAPVAELAGGGYLLTRHADIRAAFTDRALGNAPSRFSTLSARNAQKYVAADLAAHISPFLDGDAHRPVRQMLSRAFFNTFKCFSPELDTLAEAHARALANGDDLIARASAPFSLRAMAAFCGTPAGPEEMKPLTQAFFHLFAPLRDPQVFAGVNDALAQFRDVLRRALRSGPPAGSLLAELQAYAAEHEGITEAQIVDNCLLVFADGVENIEAGAASLLLRFERAGALAPLRSGEMALEAAIREGLRLDTPAQLVPRVARADCEIAGTQIKKDMPVFLALASGNRDPEVFAEPDRFDPARDLDPVLTFGQGKHRCIGEPLGIAQLTALLRALIAAGVAPAESTLRYQSRIGHRWPHALLIKKG